MLIRPALSLLYLLAAGPLVSQPLRAQCLPLESLNQQIAAGRLRVNDVLDLLEAGDWLAHEGPNPYWTFRTAGEVETPEAQAQAWVGLRSSNQNGYYDLVYKTKHHACIAQLRAHLRQQAKLQSEPISCVQCEGERLVGEGYTISIFNQKANYDARRTAFPYVLVIRSNSAASNSQVFPEAASQSGSKP